MKKYSNLYSKICCEKNLELAWKKARKRKTLKPYVIEFERNIKENLSQLRIELIFHFYKPRPLDTFTIRDPKTRKISVSNFRDRVVHHAICNIIEPIYDKMFIADSFANRKGKGTLNAIKRLNKFQKKVSHNRTIVNKFSKKNNLIGFYLKCDIKHYFDTVNHKTLLNILKRKIQDEELIFLIRKILKNHKGKKEGNGMPLGNLTSQFFANVYLNELDYFVKHNLKAKHYIRYVDDFVILHNSKEQLEGYKQEIVNFLQKDLLLELSKDKSVIKPLNRGINFLGFRNFYYHNLLKKGSSKRFYHKLNDYTKKFENRRVDYDSIYDFLEGWLAYSSNANTYNLRAKILEQIEEKFSGEVSAKDVNRLLKKESKLQFLVKNQ